MSSVMAGLFFLAQRTAHGVFYGAARELCRNKDPNTASCCRAAVKECRPMTMVRFPRLVAPLEVALVAAARSIARSHPAKWKRAVMAGLFSLGIPTMIGAQPVSTGPEF